MCDHSITVVWPAEAPGMVHHLHESYASTGCKGLKWETIGLHLWWAVLKITTLGYLYHDLDSSFAHISGLLQSQGIRNGDGNMEHSGTCLLYWPISLLVSRFTHQSMVIQESFTFLTLEGIVTVLVDALFEVFLLLTLWDASFPLGLMDDTKKNLFLRTLKNSLASILNMNQP